MPEAKIKNEEHRRAIVVANLNNPRFTPILQESADGALWLDYPAESGFIINSLIDLKVPNARLPDGRIEREDREGYYYVSQSNSVSVWGEKIFAKLADAGVIFPGSEFHKTEKDKAWTERKESLKKQAKITYPR